MLAKPLLDIWTSISRETKLQPYHLTLLHKKAGAQMDLALNRLASLLLNVDTSESTLGPSTAQNTYVLAQAFLAKILIRRRRRYCDRIQDH